MKLLTTVLLTALIAFPQTPGSLRVTDTEKIADALRAGPTFITAHATVLDWPSAPGGEYRLLRKRIERMDLSPRYSWISARYVRLRIQD